MNHLTAYDPFAESGIDEVFRGFFRPVRVEKAPATIKMDVTEQDDAYLVKAEIPGVGKDGSQVTIGAEVKREKDVKNGERVLRSERYFGSVYRVFTLPVEVDEAASQAKYENGVLELKLVKKPATSKLNAAVREKTCASPVHPSRSSRWGQSVGTPTKFPFCPHTML